MAFCSFENLHVYRLAENLSDALWTEVLSWRAFEKNTIGQQLVQAADSIGANIAEGAGRGTPKDNRRFVRIARGSLNETKHWLRRADKRALFNHDQSEMIKTIIDELAPRLNAYLNSIGNEKKDVPK